MPTVADFVEYLFWLTIAAYVVLYLRLRQQGLDRIYRVFTIYLLFRAARASLLAALPPLWYALEHQPYKRFWNNVYGGGWTLTEPIQWILNILVVLELFSLVLQNHKGIASLGRWVVFAGLMIAVGLSALTLPADLSHSAEQSPILRYWFVVGRGVDTSIVIFLLLITAFLVWFPVPLSRNVVLYSMVYALFFLSSALAELVQNLRGGAVWGAVSLAFFFLNFLCVGIWIVFLNRAGESQTVVVRHAWAPQHEENLVRQLAAINASLMRSARR
jgi:hypothetical protein